MQHDTCAPLTVRDKVACIGTKLAKLDPGPLADLRRMSLDDKGPGAPYFWRLAAQLNLEAGKTQRERATRLRAWERIV